MKKIILSILILILLVSAFGCHKESDEFGLKYKHPDFVTEYTEQEHIDKIKARTEERFEDELKRNKIVNYTVEIVYSFYDNDPEYFLVEIEYAEPWLREYANPDCTLDDIANGSDKPERILRSIKYTHLIGYIYKDEYYLYTRYYGRFMEGRSAYCLSGYENNKKYFGKGVQAVLVDDELLQVFDDACFVDGVEEYNSVEYHVHLLTTCSMTNEVIPKSKHKDLMGNDFMPKRLKY